MISYVIPHMYAGRVTLIRATGVFKAGALYWLVVLYIYSACFRRVIGERFTNMLSMPKFVVDCKTGNI